MLVLAIGTVADADTINVANDSIVFVLMSFLGLIRVVRVTDDILFDIPPEQEDVPLQFTHPKGIHINNLSDTAVLKMTHFNWCQLRHLYTAFDFKGQLEPMEDKFAFPTGHFTNGTPCHYRVHPEEVFCSPCVD